MSRPPRISSFPYTGLYRYFLTFCAFERRCPFINVEVVSPTLEQFRKTAEEEVIDLLAYCFMPDHVHLLVEGRAEHSDLRRFCKLAKQRAGSKYSRKFGSRLWQEGYHDRVLRDEEDLRDIARYLLNNPVRAGLVKSPTDYPHLGSDRWTLSELIEGQR